MRSLTGRILLLLSVVAAGAPAAHAQGTLEELRASWRAGDYQDAYDGLKQYRKQPYGKTFEVYYMAGTSLCRLPGRAQLGSKYLQWVMDNYSLSADARSTVEDEQQTKCPPTGQGNPIVIAWNTTAATAGVSGRTKMFYWADRENALRSVPVEVVREIPRGEIEARLFRPDAFEEAKASAARLAARAVGRGGPRPAIGASEHFVLASLAGHSASQLAQMAGVLDRAYNFFVAEYGMRPPESLVTGYLVADPAMMQRLAESLHGIRVAPQSLGYSYRDDLSMVGYIPGSSVGTLLHELFHLMVRNDFGDIPPWLDEGLAALYEVSTISERSVRGTPNWRGRVLEELSREEPSVEELVGMNWPEFSAAANAGGAGGAVEEDEYSTARQAANHAKARYLMLYLQETGKLTMVYKRFQAREVGTDSVELLRETLGVKDLSYVEQAFRAWFQAL